MNLFKNSLKLCVSDKNMICDITLQQKGQPSNWRHKTGKNWNRKVNSMLRH